MCRKCRLCLELCNYSKSVGCYMIILSIQVIDRWCFIEPLSQPGRQVIAPCSAETPRGRALAQVGQS